MKTSCLRLKLVELNFFASFNADDQRKICVSNVSKETDTVEKFENILYTILDDDNISTLDTFKIMKQLEADIIKQHRNEDIRTVLDVVAGISKYIYVTSKEIELKYEREEISHYLTEKQKELTKEAEELVKYIIQSDEEDY